RAGGRHIFQDEDGRARPRRARGQPCAFPQRPMRTLVLVLSSHAAPYPTLIRTIKRTWASVPVVGVDTVFYFGGRELEANGRDLNLPVPDDLPHVGEKTLACFEYVLANREFDLVFRTNCSSYVDLLNLREFVRAKAAQERFYSGNVA